MRLTHGKRLLLAPLNNEVQTNMFERNNNEELVQKALKRQGLRLGKILREMSQYRGFDDFSEFACYVAMRAQITSDPVLALMRTGKLPNLRTLLKIFDALEYRLLMSFDPGRKLARVCRYSHAFFLFGADNEKFLAYNLNVLLWGTQRVCGIKNTPKVRRRRGAHLPTLATINRQAILLGWRLVITPRPMPHLCYCLRSKKVWREACSR